HLIVRKYGSARWKKRFTFARGVNSRLPKRNLIFPAFLTRLSVLAVVVILNYIGRLLRCKFVLWHFGTYFAHAHNITPLPTLYKQGIFRYNSSDYEKQPTPNRL